MSVVLFLVSWSYNGLVQMDYALFTNTCYENGQEVDNCAVSSKLGSYRMFNNFPVRKLPHSFFISGSVYCLV